MLNIDYECNSVTKSQSMGFRVSINCFFGSIFKIWLLIEAYIVDSSYAKELTALSGHLSVFDRSSAQSSSLICHKFIGKDLSNKSIFRLDSPLIVFVGLDSWRLEKRTDARG